MPIYQYECKTCGQRFEKMQSITSDPIQVCELCGEGPVRRVMHPVGIIFKGSGWYATDNRKSRPPAESSGGSSDSKSESSPKSSSESSSSSD